MLEKIAVVECLSAVIPDAGTMPRAAVFPEEVHDARAPGAADFRLVEHFVQREARVEFLLLPDSVIAATPAKTAQFGAGSPRKNTPTVSAAAKPTISPTPPPLGVGAE